MDQPPIHSPSAPRPEKIDYPLNPRLGRMRALSRLLDNSIPLPGGYRIGIDPIIGLVPALGDFIATTLSVWLIYDAARLGLPKRQLFRMAINVIIEAAAGAIPLLGDIFDAAWKANARNMKIVELNYHPETPPRPRRKIIFILLFCLAVFYLGLFALLYLVATLILSIFS